MTRVELTSQWLRLCRLNFCCVTTESCNHIAQALVYTTTLRILDLGSNMLGDGGVAILCEALKQSSCKLQELW